MKRINLKAIVYKILLTCLVSGGVYFIAYGEVGALAYVSMKREVDQKEQELVALQEEVTQMQKTIQHWNKYSYHLEKYAREELCMGYPGEVMYKIKRED